MSIFSKKYPIIRRKIMNLKWLLVIVLIINIVITLYALSYNFVTFAEIYPNDIIFDITNYVSVKNAIIKAYYSALERGRRIFGQGTFILAWLVLFNFLIIVFLVIKNHKREK